ncbi:MAG: M20 family metallopeptidase [Longimicrobiales bacterium]|nr:M20 family metallopeptidase [Longimicrobiales bacterium]
MTRDDPLLAAARRRADSALALIRELAEIESPTGCGPGVKRVFDRLIPEFEARGFRVRRIPDRSRADAATDARDETSPGHLLALPPERPHGAPLQLVIGHVDTVWPVGTLETMPVRVEEGRLHGPGVFDMKGGVAQALVALDVLADAGVTPAALPLFFLNSDEETGSPDSKRHVRRLGRIVERALVAEPAFGEEGRLKTARKGILRFRVIAHGRSAHAGLDPEAGRSAIEALAHATLALHRLNDPAAGTTVNVGRVSGGTRANVVAARAEADVDARVVTEEAALKIESAIAGLTSAVEGVRLEILGGRVCPPFERTTRNQRLWERARDAAHALGFDIEEASVGGGSDGNTLSPLTATLDGLGAVGDGAHADHEHLVIDRVPERIALFAALLAAPLDDGLR